MKRYFSQKGALQFVFCFFLFLESFTLILALTDDNVARKYITIIAFNFLFVIGGIPMLIIGLGTINFYEDRIVYKNSLFSRKQEISYHDITEVIIDYQNHPKGLKSAVSSKIYIIEKRKIRCHTDISFGIIKQLLEYIEKSKITVSFSEELYGFPKKHRRLLYEYLKTEKQKRIVAESFKKDVDISIVVTCSENKNNLEECLNSILQQDYKRSRYEILLIMESYSERMEELAKKCLLGSGVFYRSFVIKGKNSNIRTIINNNALSEQLYFMDEKESLTNTPLLKKL